MVRDLRLVVIALVMLGATSASASAQANNLDREHSTACLVEFSHPFLQFPTVQGDIIVDGPVFDNPSASTGVLLVAARHRFGSAVAVVVDAPTAHFETEMSGSFYVGSDSLGHPIFAPGKRSVSETTLGNCYFGVELLTQGSPLIWEIGVRPNFQSNGFAGIAGVASDLTLWEAFENSASYRVGVRTHTNLSRPTSLRFRGGFTAMSGSAAFSAGATVQQRLGAWLLMPAFDARADANSEVTDNVVAQGEVALERETAHARPGAFARFYFNSDWHDRVSWTLGVRCNAF